MTHAEGTSAMLQLSQFTGAISVPLFPQILCLRGWDTALSLERRGEERSGRERWKAPAPLLASCLSQRWARTGLSSEWDERHSLTWNWSGLLWMPGCSNWEWAQSYGASPGEPRVGMEDLTCIRGKRVLVKRENSSLPPPWKVPFIHQISNRYKQKYSDTVSGSAGFLAQV